MIWLQGLTIASALQDSPLNPRGLVWDSCPGPRPHVTIPKGLVLCIINWLSRMRDGMSLVEAVRSSADDFRVLAWRNYLRRLRGQEALISTMDNTWTGAWARDLNCHLPTMLPWNQQLLHPTQMLLLPRFFPTPLNQLSTLKQCEPAYLY